MSSDKTLLLTESEVRAWCISALKKCELGEDYAATVADALVSANLRGVDTHGINLLQYYIRRFLKVGHNEIRILSDMPATANIDGGNNMGPAVGVFAMDKAIAKAASCGIGMSLVRSSCHFGAAGYYSCRAAERGYIGFAISESYVLMTPWGGMETFIGNNPFSAAFPWREFPIMLDIANSVTARNKIINYAREGRELPPDWATDANGNPTTDANEAIKGFLQPIAGHKGVGIAMIIEIILGTLTGGQYSRTIRANFDTDGTQNIPHMFIAVKPEAFIPREELEDNIERFVADFRAVKRREDTPKLMLPGEIEYICQRERRANGIPLPSVLVDELNEFSREHGFPTL